MWQDNALNPSLSASLRHTRIITNVDLVQHPFYGVLRICVPVYRKIRLVSLKDIYCTGSIYSVYKDKLQNCSCNQFE
jgi:hypothetical protein